MRKIFIITTLLLVAYSSFALDFRRASWLMTRDQVVDSENGQFVAETKVGSHLEVIFRILIKGHSGSITYIFENNLLVAASYRFKADTGGEVFTYMKETIASSWGAPAFQSDTLVGWRLEATEIALTYLPDRTCYVAYWEKGYFAKMNNLSSSPGAPSS